MIRIIKENNLFCNVNFVPSEYWKILLFKDGHNHAGIKESNPDKVSNRWDIVEHLPEAVRKKFINTASEFIHMTYKYNQKYNAIA